MHYTLVRTQLTPERMEQLTEQLKQYDRVVVDLHDVSSGRGRVHQLTKEELELLGTLEEHTCLVLVVFGNAYSLSLFPHFKHLIAAYEEDPVAEDVAAQIVCGALPAQGKLPVSISGAWPAGWGITTKAIQRLGYTYPEGVGMSSQVLHTIDALAEEAIDTGATPGCQVLVAKGGKVVFEKAYGHHTYAAQRPIALDTLYDLSSVTKVVGPLQAIMYLAGQGRIDVRQRLAYYLPILQGSNKKRIRLHRLLAHQAGLKAYCLSDMKPLLLHGQQALAPTLFQAHPSATYCHPLSAHLYGASLLKTLVWESCVASAMQNRGWFRRPSYCYSCIGFYLLHRLIEGQLRQPLDTFLATHFFAPLGLSHITYRPLEKFEPHQIAPTEVESFWGRGLVQGIVHDPKAALYGGVAGNAGLFGNAHDLAVLLQMNLQDGYYGGQRYLVPGTVQQFTAQYAKHDQRGLGWDKPRRGNGCYVSSYASADTYGHSGFTGTVAWVDPKHELIFIFLSNRTYPSADNGKLNQQKTRARLHDVVYAAMD